MASLPAKRRKLSHNSNVNVAPVRHSDSNDSTDDIPRDDVPMSDPKETHSRLKRGRAEDDDALYSGGLYKSSMFKLQVDEMLAEVRPNYEKRLGGVDNALRRLKSLIEVIENRESLAIPEAIKLLQKSHKIAVPFPDPKPNKDAAYKLLYEKPSHINVVGSYALKMMIKSDGVLSVDMVVTMPASILQEKDYLNYRYFYKRAYYLACIAAGLQDKAQSEFTLDFGYLNGNSLHPILIAKSKSDKPKTESEAGYQIHIILAAPPHFFAGSKLRPSKNSLRPKSTTDGEAISLAPSPFYNASIQSDCNVEPYLKLLHTASKQSDGFKDACLLGRIWLRQRGFGSDVSQGGFGHFEWAVLTALLLKGGGPKGHSILSPGYSSYQMFKAIVQFLSTTNLAVKPIVCGSTDFIPSKSDVPMLFDSQRDQNILYKMTPWSYGLLRDETKTSLLMLNDVTFDQFEATFIIRTDQPLQRYDCMIRLPIPAQSAESYSSDHSSHTSRFSSKVFDILSEGLSDRVKLINLKGHKAQSWPIKSGNPLSSGNESLLIAVVFDPANITRLVDHGPSAEEKKKAAKFQKFWGEKAELRRFKDGSILESLVWSSGSAYSIFQDIVTYLVKRHLDVEVSRNLTFVGEAFEKSLPVSGTSMKAFEALKQAFSMFESNVKDLESLPLQLRQLSPMSPALRYSSIQPPSFHPRHPLSEPADVLIQFEGSGRWPDDVVAIQRTKIAFLLKIGSLLKEADDSISTRLGLENEDQSLRNCTFLDIIYQSGATFRLRIHSDREQTLLERQIKEKSTDQRSREDAVNALSTYKRIFIQLPLHTQSIATHCTRFPLFSPTIRLVKMWFDQHMLLDHISEEFIELLVAHTFLQPHPWTAPSSVMSGFLRTLLFISRWDWRLVPLIVDFTGTMTSKDIASIHIRLEAWRKIDPGMNRTVLFAASNHDATGTAFTEKGPSKMAAARMTALARSARKIVKDQGLDLDQRSLFATSTKDYDFVIHLNLKYTRDVTQKSSTQHQFKNIAVQSEVNVEQIGYQPIRLFLDELEKQYTSSVVFFRSQVDGRFIAGLWNPQTLTPRPFKVNIAYATKPESGEDSKSVGIEIDKTAILSEIARIGGNMVLKIEVNR